MSIDVHALQILASFNDSKSQSDRFKNLQKSFNF